MLRGRSGADNPAYKHGLSNTRTFRIWAGMLSRCQNPRVRNYGDYGGRGIKVCAHWQEFANFLADMGMAPAGMSIERGNNDVGYEPGNCKWATSAEQNKNSRHNVYIDYYGKRMLISECADMLGIKRPTLTMRVKNGWVAPDLFRAANQRIR